MGVSKVFYKMEHAVESECRRSHPSVFVIYVVFENGGQLYVV